MALTDFLTAPTPRDTITCPKFERGEGKRCLHYLPNGACGRPDEFICVEWLRVNAPSDRSTQPERPERLPRRS